MASGDYIIESIYEPGSSSFIPTKEDSPYLGKQNLVSMQQMGMTTDPRTANQLSEISRNLNVGAINFEMGTMDMPTFDTIPKQHLEEIRRKAKLAEAKISLHAPIQAMDPAGFTDRGWEEGNKELVERQLKSVIERAGIIDSTGNMPVTIHGSNTAGSTFKMVKQDDGTTKKEYDQMMAINKETGQIVPMKTELKYYPEHEVRERPFSPKRQLESANLTQWDTDVDKVIFQKEHADRLLGENFPVGSELFTHMQNLKTPKEKNEFFNSLPQTQKEIMMNLRTASAHLDDAALSARALFSKAYRYGSEEQKKQLDGVSKRFAKEIYGIDKDIYKIKSDKDLTEAEIRSYNRAKIDLQSQSRAIHSLSEEIREINPNMFQTIEEFSTEKGSETFANVALHSFKKFGEGAPVISIENLYQGMGFSQGKDLDKLVKESQKKFVESAVKEEGLSKSEAERMAKKLIGVTFDVGHLNISKGRGFTDDDLVKEAEAIKKHVKHIHITDNFGHSDTHLPIGMGNVPVEKLLDAMGERGKKLRKINEVGGWFQHFKTNPFPQILEAAGSQIYSSGQGPYWSQAGGFQQSYSEGYGMMLPQKHYETFGAGFSQLPSSLGGQVGGGAGGRMGGGKD